MQDKVFNIIKTCRVCKSSNLKNISDTNYLSLASPNTGIELSGKNKNYNQDNTVPLTFALCIDCLNMQINETVNPNILYKNFKYVSAITHGLVDHFENFSKECFEDNELTNEDLILDIGSNDGSLLIPFKKLGCKVLGVEPATDLANKITNMGIETIGDFFTHSLAKEIRRKYGFPKIITCNNTIANINNLNDFCLGIRELCNQNTVIYIETQYGMDVIEKNLIDTIYHEHLNYFTVSSIARLFSEFNLYISNYKFLSNKGGSIRVRLTKHKSDNVQIPEESLGNIYKFISQNKSVNNNCRAEINKIIDNAKLNKIPIYLFGSSVSCVSLATQINFNLEDIKCILDENPLASKCKINEIILNIKRLKDVKFEEKALILNLAYRYSDVIYTKNKIKFSQIKFINIFPIVKKVN